MASKHLNWCGTLMVSHCITVQSAPPGLFSVSLLTYIPCRHVFEVVLTAGPGKPSDNDYLVEFIEELHALMGSGLEWEGRTFQVKVKAVRKKKYKVRDSILVARGGVGDWVPAVVLL